MLIAIILFILFLSLIPNISFAYLDPGTGSYIIQMVMVGLGMVVFGIKMFWEKIKEFSKVSYSKFRKNKKNADITIGYAYVCADLMHVGHINHLEACRKLCDKLIVGVLTDKAVMEKKPRPIFCFEERLRLVQSLKCVDVAVSQETYSPLNNASAIADILFESTSHTKEAIDEAKQIMGKLNKKVIIMPYYNGQSSTAIKVKIKKEWKGNININKV